MVGGMALVELVVRRVTPVASAAGSGIRSLRFGTQQLLLTTIVRLHILLAVKQQTSCRPIKIKLARIGARLHPRVTWSDMSRANGCPSFSRLPSYPS